MSTPAGDAFALILFFGRGRGRGGRATAKPTVSRRTSADGFAVKMKRTKAGGRIVKSCSPFSAAKWQRQKSRRSRGKGGDFLRSKKYPLLPLDCLDFCRCHFAAENGEQDLTTLPPAFVRSILTAKPSALVRRLSVGFAVALPPRPRPLPKNRIRAGASPAGGVMNGKTALLRCAHT